LEVRRYMAWTDSQKKYYYSPKGVDARRRYQQSAKGKAAAKRYYEKRKALKKAAKEIRPVEVKLVVNKVNTVKPETVNNKKEVKKQNKKV
jgi:hypothetical protein